jgi:hypothetical protein
MDSLESQLPRIDSIFIHMGGPQAHVNSHKCQTATATRQRRGISSAFRPLALDLGGIGRL